MRKTLKSLTILPLFFAMAVNAQQTSPTGPQPVKQISPTGPQPSKQISPTGPQPSKKTVHHKVKKKKAVKPVTSSTGTIKRLIIGPYTVDCVGVGPMKCMQVKENASDNWTNFYDKIEGFTFEPGYEYVLKVKEEKVANPPADASSVRYTLIKQISKVIK